ncbi:MAG: rhodanese-related sulfurtransferase [Bacteroidia bacterium]|nr:rhodanese-related sulfurtransferase [Bacteroidia bacterium]
METTQPYQVLLYYKYVRLSDLESIQKEQFDLCRKLNLLGRILIAKEGINGTVSGLISDTEVYMETMKKHPLFHGIEFKVDQYHQHTFNKLHVRIKNEIVHLGQANQEIDPLTETGKYIEPHEFLRALKEGSEDVVILDARSRYEYELGKFKNAITFDIENFRELPNRLAEIEHLKDKKILTYCTGGIKCEKASALLLKHGFKEVYQLHGGIVRYAKETGGEDFEGQCYVFDQRVTVPVNKVNPVVIGRCFRCKNPTEKMINCANAECNRHILLCENCCTELEGCCSEECHSAPHRRVYDGRGYYLRGVNSKNYVQPK